jgi:hypothetical protein
MLHHPPPPPPSQHPPPFPPRPPTQERPREGRIGASQGVGQGRLEAICIHGVAVDRPRLQQGHLGCTDQQPGVALDRGGDGRVNLQRTEWECGGAVLRVEVQTRVYGGGGWTALQQCCQSWLLPVAGCVLLQHPQHFLWAAAVTVCLETGKMAVPGSSHLPPHTADFIAFTLSVNTPCMLLRVWQTQGSWRTPASLG